MTMSREDMYHTNIEVYDQEPGNTFLEPGIEEEKKELSSI